MSDKPVSVKFVENLKTVEALWALLLLISASLKPIIDYFKTSTSVEAASVIQIILLAALLASAVFYLRNLKARIKRIEITNDVQQRLIEIRSKSVMRLNRLQEGDFDKGQEITRQQMKNDRDAIMAVLRSNYSHLKVTECDRIVEDFLNNRIYE